MAAGGIGLKNCSIQFDVLRTTQLRLGFKQSGKKKKER